jgi:hypothetical protein
MIHAAGPRTCKGAALVSWSFATPQRIGADDKSGPASHLTLNRLAGGAHTMRAFPIPSMHLALLPICSTF